jgi:Type VI secretion system (T6SS), amidase effector protein 4
MALSRCTITFYELYPEQSMTSPPSFSKLRTNFPYKPGGSGSSGAYFGGNKDLITTIGGQLLKSLSGIYKDLDAMNTCAVRLSYCLNRSGHKIVPTKGVRTYMGADKNLYTISADEMITYMKGKFGNPVKIWDGNKAAGKQLLGTVTPPTQGIFGYDWQGRTADFGASGHVDIGKLTNPDNLSISEIGTGQYFIGGAMIVYFWACKI